MRSQKWPLTGCWESSARTGLIAMCIALSCNAFPKASRRKPSCADRWEKIAGRGSQAALDEHAPQQVRDCPSLGLLQQVWNQHFERVEGRIGFRDGPAVESAERVISPYETDARESRKRETEWVGYVRRVGADEIPA